MNDGVRTHARKPEERFDHPRNDRLADPAKSEAGQRDSELGGRKVGLQVACDQACNGGPRIAFLDHRVESA